MDEKVEKRRSSILKFKKPTTENIQEVETVVKRRVSFSQKKFVKEFDASSNTMQNSTYEEITKESDSGQSLDKMEVGENLFMSTQVSSVHIASSVMLSQIVKDKENMNPVIFTTQNAVRHRGPFSPLDANPEKTVLNCNTMDLTTFIPSNNRSVRNFNNMEEFNAETMDMTHIVCPVSRKSIFNATTRTEAMDFTIPIPSNRQINRQSILNPETMETTCAFPFSEDEPAVESGFGQRDLFGGKIIKDTMELTNFIGKNSNSNKADCDVSVPEEQSSMDMDLTAVNENYVEHEVSRKSNALAPEIEQEQLCPFNLTNRKSPVNDIDVKETSSNALVRGVECNNLLYNYAKKKSLPVYDVGGGVMEQIQNCSIKDKISASPFLQINPLTINLNRWDCESRKNSLINCNTTTNYSADDTEYLINFSVGGSKNPKSDFSRLIAGEFNPSFLSSKFLPLSEFESDAFTYEAEQENKKITDEESLRQSINKENDCVTLQKSITRQIARETNENEIYAIENAFASQKNRGQALESLRKNRTEQGNQRVTEESLRKSINKENDCITLPKRITRQTAKEINENEIYEIENAFASQKNRGQALVSLRMNYTEQENQRVTEESLRKSINKENDCIALQKSITQQIAREAIENEIYDIKSQKNREQTLESLRMNRTEQGNQRVTEESLRKSINKENDCITLQKSKTPQIYRGTNENEIYEIENVFASQRNREQALESLCMNRTEQENQRVTEQSLRKSINKENDFIALQKSITQQTAREANENEIYDIKSQQNREQALESLRMNRTEQGNQRVIEESLRKSINKENDCITLPKKTTRQTTKEINENEIYEIENAFASQKNRGQALESLRMNRTEQENQRVTEESLRKSINKENDCVTLQKSITQQTAREAIENEIYQIKNVPAIHKNREQALESLRMSRTEQGNQRVTEQSLRKSINKEKDSVTIQKSKTPQISRGTNENEIYEIENVFASQRNREQALESLRMNRTEQGVTEESLRKSINKENDCVTLQKRITRQTAKETNESEIHEIKNISGTLRRSCSDSSTEVPNKVPKLEDVAGKDKTYTVLTGNTFTVMSEIIDSDTRNISDESVVSFCNNSSDVLEMNAESEQTDKVDEFKEVFDSFYNEFVTEVNENELAMQKEIQKIEQRQIAYEKRQPYFEEICQKISTLLSVTFEVPIEKLNLNGADLNLGDQSSLGETNTESTTPSEFSEIDKELRSMCEKVSTIQDRMEELQKKCQDCWSLVSSTSEEYTFETLYRTVLFTVRIDKLSGIVNSLSVQSKPDGDCIPKKVFIKNEFIKRMNSKTVSGAVGEKYDIFTLLDYVQMEMVHMNDMKKYFSNLSRIGFEMDRDFRVTLKIPSLILRTVWVITVDMSDIDNIDQDCVSIKAQVGVVDEEKMKSLIVPCPKGFAFLKHLVVTLLNYLKMLESRKKK